MDVGIATLLSPLPVVSSDLASSLHCSRSSSERCWIQRAPKKEKDFLLTTTILSAVIALLYLWNGFSEGFLIGTYIIISLAFIYVPVVWIFGKPGFTLFNLIYGLILVFIIAFHKTYLYNNYTGLIAVFIVMMIMPNLKWHALALYFTAITIAFALNEENLCHYLIHITRAIWLFYIFNHILENKYKRKKLILYEDEIKILNELSKNRLQKSIELDGFSESTIYRRIKSACLRNNLTKKQLLEEFKKEQCKADWFFIFEVFWITLTDFWRFSSLIWC